MEPVKQIELLEIIFATIFIKKSDIKANQLELENSNLPISFICKKKEVRLLLFILKTVTDKVWLEKQYPQGSEACKRLDQLRKNVTDALWRLDLIESLPKCKKSLLHYMLAEGETLLNICLKCAEFSKAVEVLKVFNLTDTKLAEDVYYLNRLEELKDRLGHISKKEILNGCDSDNTDVTYADLVKQFIQKYPVLVDDEEDRMIIENQNYPFLKHYLSKNSSFFNVLDLALTQTNTAAESHALIKLASTYYVATDVTESSFLRFYKRLALFYQQTGLENKLFIMNLLLDPQNLLDLRYYMSQEEFYVRLERMCTEFYDSLDKNEEGVLNKHHKSHKAFLTISQQCGDYFSKGRYLDKLFKYLKAFSRVLYLEGDFSNLISNNKNTSFFKLLSYNRSELMGKLLFDQNLDPLKFEKYFKKLKLDFLYHVTGNCFPTINLYVDENIQEDELYHENILYSPTKGVISYILKRNRLLALLLNEMYHVEGVEIDMSEIRIQNFLNFVRLPRVKHLKKNKRIRHCGNKSEYEFHG
ncbi:hypothetical protein GWI33_001492 [Rhynchophorus ferrugineus]|uniref:Uncharacterized protein n=1 Tax=Rhynchophorus ferrugineus TaxID=354439 RepID=A0A834ISM2_RHYFE|nr:hypothetical protein GWI33_001492 [Rhynchophorus ferrugineus]